MVILELGDIGITHKWGKASVCGRATEKVKRLEHLSYEERLGEGELLQLQKRRLRGSLLMCVKYLMGRTWRQFLPTDIQRQDKR